MKTRHLFAAFLAILCLQASAYDFSVIAKDYYVNALYDIELFYSINPDGKTVTLTKGPDVYKGARVNIPETVEYDGKTYTVTTIGYAAFQNSDIDYVRMPNSITEIQNKAFFYSSVDTITFSTGLKHIGDEAFLQANLIDVTLHDGIETIGEKAFFHDMRGNPTWLGRLQSIHLPNTITRIGASCFYGQPLTTIVMPENLEIIEGSMFTKLQSITLPKKLKKIGYAAFYENPISSIEFPSSLEEIGERAFWGCPLTSVTLPNSVTIVGDAAFRYNEKLTQITFSKNMRKIPANMCDGCIKLVDVTIPEGVTTIEDNAFLNCELLSHITFPESVTEIGDDALAYTGVVDFKFPSKVSTIPSMMFYQCNNLTEITIPNTITRIEREAFSKCSNLRKVTIPSSVVSTDGAVFRDCISLEEIVIPESLTTLASSLFEYCTSLRKVILPKGLKKIEGSVFSGCSALETIELPDSLEEIGSRCFRESGLSSITLPKSLYKIYGYAFSNCNKLITITIPQNVAFMGGCIFAGCNNLKEVHYQRAILPGITYLYESQNKIHNGNVCTLYVPKGAKTVYEASNDWNVFMAIVEEDVPDVYYSLKAHIAKGRGSVTVGDTDITRNAVDTLLNSTVTVTFKPADGYMIESILCNNEDITKQVTDVRLYEHEIAAVQANYNFEVSYKEEPLTLHLVSGQGGSIDVKVEKGEKFTCDFAAEEGWTVNTILFNGRDVTNEWSTEGYTTPAITYSSTLSVSFESLNAIEATRTSNVKAYSPSQGTLVIEGLKNGESVAIYNAGGVPVKSFNAGNSKETISLQSGVIYIVKTADTTIKVAL